MNTKYTMEELRNSLYSGLICDVLDQMGYRHQFLSNEMGALLPDTVVFGRAFTAVATQVYSMPEDPLTAQCKVLDQMQPGEVFVLTMRGEYNCAILGELMATAINSKGGTGAILDGMARDLKTVRDMKFPLVYRGHLPSTSKGRAEVNECQIPITIDGVTITPGDYFFGDIDGTVVIAGDLIDEVMDRAMEIERREDDVRTRLLNGESLTDTYMKIGAI